MSPTLDSPGKRWKGKARQVSRAVEGEGGRDGVVLALEMIGSGLYEVSYVLQVQAGRSGSPQTFSLQVDSGSSDLWIAGSSCSTSSCSKSGGPLYNPTTSGATNTGASFTITYLRGYVEGPVYWDRFNVGGYSIENQALSAASIVNDEPLASNFNGILGLALPLNSIIADTIPPVITNDPDGAAWASNLFSITPVSRAPASRFLSLTLARPGSDRIPSLFGIGHHPSSLVPDPSRIEYSTLVAERAGTLYWKTSVRSITVYVNGTANEIALPRGGGGSVFPTAIIDSGVPLIFATSTIANAIYGAIGISPANDGHYYVPCNQPLNMTIRLDNRSEMPLHPLDLTADPPDDNRAAFCIGLIQPADGQLGKVDSPADMILGVPFMRNVYTVMAYTQPNADGSFTPTFDPDDPENQNSNSTTPLTSLIAPRLGLLSLTDPTVALEEFRTVRILNQPINGNSTGGKGGSGSGTGAPSTDNPTSPDGVGGLNTGIIVLIALLSFFGLCCVIFLVRWILQRKRFSRRGQLGAGNGANGSDEWINGDTKRELVMGSMLGLGGGGYQLANMRNGKREGDRDSTTDTAAETLRDKKADDLSKQESRGSGDGTLYSSQASGKGGVGAAVLVDSRRSEDGDEGGHDGQSTNGPGHDRIDASFADKQQAQPLQPEDEDPWDPSTGLPWSVTSTAPVSSSLSENKRGHRARMDSTTLPPQALFSPPSDRSLSPERPQYRPHSPQHPHHRHQSSTVAPLLQNQESRYEDSRPPQSPESVYSFNSGAHQPASALAPHPLSPDFPPALPKDKDSALPSTDLWNLDTGGGMAGVGTASRTKKISALDGRTPIGVNLYDPRSNRSRSRTRSNGSRKSALGYEGGGIPPLPEERGTAF